MSIEERYDYIIVGGGSSGSVLAQRLAANSDKRVCLIEAGSRPRNPLLHIPLGFAFLLKKHANNWNYTCKPSWEDRGSIELYRGKVLGGCGAINGMVYVRGQPQDYDDWAATGCMGWNYHSVKPVFESLEKNIIHGEKWDQSSSKLPLQKNLVEFPLNRRFIKECERIGIPFNNDYNRGEQNGVSFFQSNIYQGRRISPYTAFLNKHAKPDNLDILCDTEVKKVIITNEPLCKGVCVVNRGIERNIYCNNEVILCGGAINSPKLLEISGIGNRKLLNSLGIDCLQDLPGVGENLQDHWNTYLVKSPAEHETYYDRSRPISFLKSFFEYLFLGEGILSAPAAHVTAFFNPSNPLERPTSQIHFSPAASKKNDQGVMLPIPGVTMSVCNLRPTSRGYSHISSRYFSDDPIIKPNYLSTQKDQDDLLEQFKHIRGLFSEGLKSNTDFSEIRPGSDVLSDEDILTYSKQEGDPVHHLSGTCKMGIDRLSVVDSKLRVKGVNGLRIADASIIPNIVSGNTQAACMMIGAKASNIILRS